MESKENQVINLIPKLSPVETNIKVISIANSSEFNTNKQQKRLPSTMRRKTTFRKPLEPSQMASEDQVLPKTVNERKATTGKRKRVAIKANNTTFVDEIGSSGEAQQLAELRIQLGEILSAQASLKAKEKRLRQSIRKMQRSVASALLLAEEEPIDQILARIFERRSLQVTPCLHTDKCSSILWELSRQTPEYEECRKKRRVNINDQSTKLEEIVEIERVKEIHVEELLLIERGESRDLIDIVDDNPSAHSLLSQILNELDSTKNTDVVSKLDESAENSTEDINGKFQQCLDQINEILAITDDNLKRDFLGSIGKIVAGHQIQFDELRIQQSRQDDKIYRGRDGNMDMEAGDPSPQKFVDLVSPAGNTSQGGDLLCQLELQELRWLQDHGESMQPVEKLFLETSANASQHTSKLQGKVSIGTASSVSTPETIAHSKWSEFSDNQLKELADQYGLKFQNREKMVKLLDQMEGKLHLHRTTTACKGDPKQLNFISSDELIKFLQVQEDLYQRILCFQPISLDEVYSRLLLEGYSTTKDHLLSTLDSLAIFVNATTTKSRTKKSMGRTGEIN